MLSTSQYRMSKISTFKLEGLVPATFTPMDEDGELDLDKISDYCNYLVSRDLTQIYVNGTTGEGFSLTLEERKQVLEKWLVEGKGKLKSVVAHVGGLNLHDSIDLARHAVEAGADAIASVPPLFFKPRSIDVLIKYCQEVAAAAPDHPFYYYHLPTATGVEHCMEDFLKEAMKHIPSLAGIKFSSKDTVDMIGCVHIDAKHRADGKLNLMFGCDEKLLAGMVMGADGAVGSTHNFMPRLYQRMLKDLNNGDIAAARQEQYRAQQTCKILYKYGDLLGNNVGALKYFMPMVGLDLGPPRSPMRKMSQSEFNMFKTELQEIGFFDWYN